MAARPAPSAPAAAITTAARGLERIGSSFSGSGERRTATAISAEWKTPSGADATRRQADTRASATRGRRPEAVRASRTKEAIHGRSANEEGVETNGTIDTEGPESPKTSPATAALSGARPSRRAEGANPTTPRGRGRTEHALIAPRSGRAPERR